MKQLTTQQKNKLKEHSKHHTDKHMRFMKQRMKEGDSFTVAHNKAKKEDRRKEIAEKLYGGNK
tara:strand:+ start:442 stop:630 length:189 start_codon:yes stop_codon:yes gene_type:complete